MRLIIKWLNAGVMEGTDWTDTGRGTPQGAIVSACLANVYLHYVLDDWFHNTWRKRMAGGDTIIVRYADDFVCGFQHLGDCEAAFSGTSVRGWPTMDWNYTRPRPGSSSSGGLRERTAASGGRESRRRSTSSA